VSPDLSPAVSDPGLPGARRRLVCGLGVAGLLALAAGCRRGGASFSAIDVTGAAFGRDFALTDHLGQPRTLADYRGKVVVVFFGFTQCPDVCPTTLAEMAQALRELGPRAERVQVLFVTVDPERDSQALLAQYVPAFDPRFVGLRGDAEAIERTAKEFKVVYQKVPGSSPGSYSVDHTAGSYVFDPKGRLRLFVRHGKGPGPLAADIAQLLDGA
jgi:protein SCO1/2